MKQEEIMQKETINISIIQVEKQSMFLQKKKRRRHIRVLELKLLSLTIMAFLEEILKILNKEEYLNKAKINVIPLYNIAFLISQLYR